MKSTNILVLIFKNTYQVAGLFVNGDLALNEKRNEIYLCINTNTHRPQAFRCIFKKKKNIWQPCFGNPQRFGYNKEFCKISIE